MSLLFFFLERKSWSFSFLQILTQIHPFIGSSWVILIYCSQQLIFNKKYLCACALCAYICMYMYMCIHSCCPRRPEENILFHGTEVVEFCELSWSKELNLDSFARSACALDCRTISPIVHIFFASLLFRPSSNISFWSSREENRHL